LHISGPDEQQVARAKALTEDLLEVVRAEHAKVKTVVHQQQMELHQAQLQYAAYSAYVCITLLIQSSLLPLPSADLLDGVISPIHFRFVWFLLLLTDRGCWQSQNSYGGAPPPPDDAPPPPPGEAPPQPGAPQQQQSMDPAAYTQYWCV